MTVHVNKGMIIVSIRNEKNIMDGVPVKCSIDVFILNILLAFRLRLIKFIAPNEYMKWTYITTQIQIYPNDVISSRCCIRMFITIRKIKKETLTMNLIKMAPALSKRLNKLIIPYKDINIPNPTA